MSDDYTDSSGGRSFGHDDMSTWDTTELRIAIHARSHELADYFWQQLGDRLRKKAKLSVCRSDHAGANVNVHLLTGEDFSDADARDVAIHRIAVNAAALNVLLEPAISDADGYQRMKEALSNLADRSGYVQFTSKKDVPAASLARHAKSVAKYLAERFAVPDLSVSKEQDELGSRESANDPVDNADEPPRQVGAKPDAIRSSEQPSGMANNRAVRKAQKHAERSARREQRKAAKDGLRLGSVSTEAAPVPEIDRPRKEGRKRAKIDAQDTARRSRSEKKARKDITGGKSKAREEGSGKPKKMVAREAKISAEAGAAAPESRAKRTRKGERAGSKRAPQKKGREKRSKSDELRQEEDGSREGRNSGFATADDVRLAKRLRKRGQDALRSGSIRGGDDAQSVSRPIPIRIRISGLSAKSLAALRPALERRSPSVVLLTAEAKHKPHAAIYAFEEPARDPEAIERCLGPIAKEGVRTRIFLERAGSAAQDLRDVNSAIAKLASASGGRVLQVTGKLERYDCLPNVDADGLTDDACELIADSILGLAASALSKPILASVVSSTPPDLAEARALADSGPDFLAKLRWNEAMPPRLLRTHTSKEAIEALVEEKLVLPSRAVLALGAPIAWPREMPDRATGIQILGLEFLIGPLDYWFSKAGGRSSGQTGEVDAMLKQHGTKASEILSRAEKVMLDFAQNYPPDRTSDAWQETMVSRRARVYALYILCCKVALARRIRFDKTAFTIIFRHLLDLIERLRADDFYRPASRDGFQQDGLLIGLALALRGSGYGDRLLVEGLDRLRRLQLETGLTSDGVWRAGTFSDHCLLLAMLRTMVVDFNKSDAVLIEPFAAAAKKMTLFAEAMLKSNGYPPTFDDSKQKSYARGLSGTRRTLAQAEGKNIPLSKIGAMPRIAETYVFRDAQYFISHSTQTVSKESSLVLLHADGPSIVEGDPGGITLAFAHGETDLLIRTEPEDAGRRDKSSLFDPALRNGYHVNGSGFDARGELRTNAARIVKSWRGPGWAAAKCVDEIDSTADLSRIVVHLKDVHALLVVDSLQSREGREATFEQFWHVAPGLSASLPRAEPLRFSAAGRGMLVAALDRHDAITVESEGEGTRIRREVRMAEGILATLFQWTEEVAAAAVDVVRDGSAGWTAAVSGAGFGGQLTLAGEELRFERSVMG